MSERPLFSIITVTRNNLAGLLKTSDSIFAQLYGDYEWVVIDGGSKDGTFEYLSGCAHPNLTWISEEDQGIYDAMNKGLRKSHGKYLIFMNAGDMFSGPDVLSLCAEEVDTLGCPDVIYGDSWEQDALGKKLFKKARSHEWVLYGMFTHHQAMFFKREAVGNGYDLRFKIGADYALVASLYKVKSAFQRVNFPVCIFECGGVSQKSTMQSIKEQFVIQKYVLGMSHILAVIIGFIHAVASFSRIILPAFYNRIRYAKDG